MEGQVIEIFGKRVKIVEAYDDDCYGCAFSQIDCCQGKYGIPLLCADIYGEAKRKFIELEPKKND